jgi:hypothetical protein
VRIAELLCPRFCAVVESCLGLRDAVTPGAGRWTLAPIRG